MSRLPIVQKLLDADRHGYVHVGEAAAVIEVLVAHIAEQSIHAVNRIADGREMGADIWRLALEDVDRENRALLSRISQPAANRPSDIRSTLDHLCATGGLAPIDWDAVNRGAKR